MVAKETIILVTTNRVHDSRKTSVQVNKFNIMNDTHEMIPYFAQKTH